MAVIPHRPPLPEGNRGAAGVTLLERVPGPEVPLLRAAFLTELPAPYEFHE
ncbi:hypothetical protein [Streptomyces sp. G-G2]|uniref:hypothetical protein n=1 Tax=Streptomyces sp. G-G2 TaxID=3046201 RepID=UPI0024BB4DC3|nr:hypothetical protein [Streptomyces sp. G-G2]MDJ0382616.1 hypothetical protein [Streptomyces sp. G-G2]